MFGCLGVCGSSLWHLEKNHLVVGGFSRCFWIHQKQDVFGIGWVLNPGPLVWNPGPLVWNPGPLVWSPGPLVWNPGPLVWSPGPLPLTVANGGFAWDSPAFFAPKQSRHGQRAGAWGLYQGRIPHVEKIIMVRRILFMKFMNVIC